MAKPQMVVIAILGGLWIAEFAGPAAQVECELYAELAEVEGIECRTFPEWAKSTPRY